MKTIVDYLIENKIYNGDIAAYEIKLKLSNNYIIMQVDDYPEHSIQIDGEINPEEEIEDILDKIYFANIRFCDECGKPFDTGFVAGDGDWYCCEECFEPTMDRDYGKGSWRTTDEEGGHGGFYEFLRDDGELEDTGIYWTEWN